MNAASPRAGERSVADTVSAAMDALRAAERARRTVIGRLMDLGVVRSWGLVADYGEYLAGRYYGVALEPPSTPGFDLETRDGKKVQVRTLRMTPENARASMGVMRDPFDVLLAIRIDQDYKPMYAIEVPRAVLEDHYPLGTRTTWTKKLERDPSVRRIEAAELCTLGAGEAGRRG